MLLTEVVTAEFLDGKVASLKFSSVVNFKLVTWTYFVQVDSQLPLAVEAILMLGRSRVQELTHAMACPRCMPQESCRRTVGNLNECPFQGFSFHHLDQ